MSHVATIEIEIKDLAALKEAGRRLGLEWREGQTTYRWFGRHVGDFPLPAGFAVSDMGVCEHALSVPGDSSAYEIGVVKNKNGKPGYTLLYDFYSGGKGLMDHIGQHAEIPAANRTRERIAGVVQQYYALCAAKRQAQARGYQCTEKKSQDGTIKLYAKRGY